MSLTGFTFFVFFLAVYGSLWIAAALCRKSGRLVSVNKAILLIASFVFMGWADWRFAICLALLSAVAYGTALRCRANKKWLAAGVTVSIVQLAVFKYLNFFVGAFTGLLGLSEQVIQIMVPLGVSFYTFSAISYMVDVYRGKYEANRSFVDVALFMSFFPKLTSGPILRADAFFDQLDAEHTVSVKNLESGVQIVVCGMLKKMVLADHLAPFVEEVYAAPAAFHGITVFLATVAYTLQIYFDFSGYSDIAIGLARMMGITINKNFDLPYLAKNPTEFWKRWHISLSSWLQEYLYYPLGGNRKGKSRTKINLLLTMLIGGLWHGADWSFIAWGGIHGLALIVHKAFAKRRAGRSAPGDYGTVKAWVSTLAMFLFANFGWIFFRADRITDAFAVIRRMLTGGEGVVHLYSWVFVALAALVIESAVALSRRKGGKVSREYLLLDLSKTYSLVLFFTAVGLLILTAYLGDTSFIYGRF